LSLSLPVLFRMPEVAEPSFTGTPENGDYVIICPDSLSQPQHALSDEDKAMYSRFARA
jgi:peptidyl-prolyl cis-trans isomerase D